VPLIRDTDGEPAGAICINDCGDLSRLDQDAAIVIRGQAAPQPMTVLVCPVCQYCEWYYGLEEWDAEAAAEEAEDAQDAAEATAEAEGAG